MSQFEKMEDEAALLHNAIQYDMIGLFYEKPSPSNTEQADWIEKHSAKFREIMDQHPDFLALYASRREEALSEVEKLLYENK